MGTRNFTSAIRSNLSRADPPRQEAILAVLGPAIPILGAEILLYLGYLRPALWIHLATFVGCSLVPLVVRGEGHLFRAFLLLPLFRLINFGMPVFVDSTLVWLALVYGSLLVATVVVADALPGVNLTDLGSLRQAVIYTPVAVAMAVVLASIEYAILSPEPLIETWGGPDMLTFVLVVGLMIGVGEEFLFRGVLQPIITDRAGAVTGVWLTGLLFGVMHSTSGLLGEILFGVAVGLLLSLIYYRTSNLLLVGLIHASINVLLYGLFPLSGPAIGF